MEEKLSALNIRKAIAAQEAIAQGKKVILKYKGQKLISATRVSINNEVITVNGYKFLASSGDYQFIIN